MKIHQAKIFTVKIAQENHFQTATKIIENKHLIKIIFADDLQTEGIHRTFRKIFSRSNIRNKQYRIQDQTEAITLIITETVSTQTLGTVTILRIVQEKHHIIEIEVNQTEENENFLKIDHKTVPTIEYFTTTTKKDPVIVPGIETTTTQTYRKTTLSHHLEVTFPIQIHNKSTEALHHNIKDKLTKYNHQRNSTRPSR